MNIIELLRNIIYKNIDNEILIKSIFTKLFYNKHLNNVKLDEFSITIDNIINIIIIDIQIIYPMYFEFHFNIDTCDYISYTKIHARQNSVIHKTTGLTWEHFFVSIYNENLNKMNDEITKVLFEFI